VNEAKTSIGIPYDKMPAKTPSVAMPIVPTPTQVPNQAEMSLGTPYEKTVAS
jgi:hypothetical protein